MPIYTFSLDKYEIKRTRSLHEDTNYVVVTLSVNGQLVGEPKVKFMGNQNDGVYTVGLTFPDVNIPEGGTATMVYSIVNSGHKDASEVEVGMSINAQSATEDGWADDFVSEIKRFFNGRCDGPITPPKGRVITWSSDALKAGGTTFVDKQDEPGNDSPSGCGKNSHYIVQYTVHAVAPVVNVSHIGGNAGGVVRDHRGGGVLLK